MRYLTAWLAAAVLAVLPAAADVEEIASLFGQADQAYRAEVSPDGRYVSMGCAPLGPPAVCIYSLTTDDKPKLFQTPEKARLRSFYWVGPKHMIIEVNLFDRLETQKGFRDFTFTRAISYNVETGNSVLLLQKDARYLLDATRIVATKPQTPDKIMMSLPFWRLEVFDVDLDSGKSKRLKTYPDEVWSVIMDNHGEEIAKVIYRSNKRFQVVLADGDVIFERKIEDEAPFRVLGLAPNGKDLLVSADNDEFYGTRILSVDTGELTEVVIDGRDFSRSGVIEDLYTNQIIGFTRTDDLREQYFLSEDFRAVHNELKAAFPEKVVRITSWTSDRKLMTAVVEAPGVPTEYYLYDSVGPSVSPLGSLAPQLQDQTLGEVLPVEYAAEDGLEIPAYLTLPSGKSRDDGPFPMILMPHGGPEARDTARFDWWAQAYAAAGYAVLQPNFRGSVGYGKTFRDAGHGEFGGKMITDTLDGYDWAVEEGIAKPGGYCIVGASYGGYAALQGAVLGGSDVKCSIAVSAVGDPIIFVRDLPEESGRYEYWTEYLGFDRFTSDEEQDAFIPLNNSASISAKLLVMHGLEDSTVPFEQARIIRNAFEHRPNFKFVEMDGEDHYLQSRDARQAVLRESLLFLDQHFPVN